MTLRFDFGQARLQDDAALQRFHAEGRWGDQLLVDLFDEQARRQPDKPAIVEAHRTLTYREVLRCTQNLAAALALRGIGHGDVVAAQAPNWAELPIVHLAANRIGAIYLPLSEGFRERELLHLLRQSRARAVFCTREYHGVQHLAMIESLRPELPDLQLVAPMRDGADGGFDAFIDDDAWRHTRGVDWLHGLRNDADAPSHVMVSSGTTGLPKCSLFSDNNTIVKLVQQYVGAAKVGADDVAAALAPAGTGATGYNYPILAMLLLGGTSAMLERWNGQRLDDVLALLERHRCTVAVAVPAQLARLVQAEGIERFDLSALRVVTNAGAKLPEPVAAAMESLFGCTVQSIYGTSEAGATAMTCVDDPVHKRRTTVGRPLDGQEVRLLDPADRDVPPGEVGEVCWRGPNKSFGFLNDEVGSRAVWDADGLLHSGDLGRIDDEGYLQIVGRKKDMIIRGGQNVNPGAIEDVLLKHPAVAEVAVVGFEDAVLGERIAACVVARTGAQPLLDSLKALVRESGLAAWHQPELLVNLGELPRNAGGKVDKAALARAATAFARGEPLATT